MLVSPEARAYLGLAAPVFLDVLHLGEALIPQELFGHVLGGQTEVAGGLDQLERRRLRRRLCSDGSESNPKSPAVPAKVSPRNSRRLQPSTFRSFMGHLPSLRSHLLLCFWTLFLVSLKSQEERERRARRAMAGAKAKPLFEAEARERQGKRTDLSANLRGSKEFAKASEDAAKLRNVSPRLIESATALIWKILGRGRSFRGRVFEGS